MDEQIGLAVLCAVAQAGDGVVGTFVCVADLNDFTDIDAGTIRTAINDLLMHKLLLCGRTEHQVCVSRAGGDYLAGCVKHGDGSAMLKDWPIRASGDASLRRYGRYVESQPGSGPAGAVGALEETRPAPVFRFHSRSEERRRAAGRRRPASLAR